MFDDQGPTQITVAGKVLQSCGVEARALIASMRPTEILFESGRVRVDGEDWLVEHVDAPSVFGIKIVASKPDEAKVILIFWRDSDHTARGWLQYGITYGRTARDQMTCLDARRLAGRFTEP